MTKITLPIYHVDADMSILGCTIKKGLQYFVSSIKSKGWVVIKEDRNEMILRGKYANIDYCTMEICYTTHKEIYKVEINFPSEPKYKEEIYKNLVDAFNDKYGKSKSSSNYHDYDYTIEKTWDFPNVKSDLKEGYYSMGNNSIWLVFEHSRDIRKYDKIYISFSDYTIRNKRDKEENERRKTEKRGFSLTDI